MSSVDSFSNSSSRFDGRSERGNVVYNNTHCVDVVHSYGDVLQRNLLFTLIGLDNVLMVKVRDVADYLFNFTAMIDWPTFDKMKHEQALDITFEELQPQVVELLKQAVAKQMLMRLEVSDSQCKVIFYEKSRIKSLIFLTIDMAFTNQKELVKEMSSSIAQLKDFNNTLSAQLALSKSQLRDTELLLKNAGAKNCQLENQFRKDLELILQTFLNHLCQTERSISTEILKLTKRHQKLICDVEKIRSDSLLQYESNTRLAQTLQSLRLESEQNQRTITELKAEIALLSNLKASSDQNCCELRQNILLKDNELESLQKQVTEMRRDIQDATMIIAQKTKTNDEIGKDLVQANQMIVNFNNRYDILLKESDELRAALNYKDNIIKEQAEEIDRIRSEFELYRASYNAEDVKKLEHELFHTRHKIDELEKRNKEAIKLNGLLTRKISAGDILAENTNARRVPPKC